MCFGCRGDQANALPALSATLVSIEAVEGGFGGFGALGYRPAHDELSKARATACSTGRAPQQMVDQRVVITDIPSSTSRATGYQQTGSGCGRGGTDSRVELGEEVREKPLEWKTDF